MIEFGGETKCLTEWAEQFSISYSVLLHRLKSGRSLAESIAMPYKKVTSIRPDR